MAKLTQFLLLLGACHAADLPTFDNPPMPGGGMMQITKALMNGKLGEFQGDPQSSE